MEHGGVSCKLDVQTCRLLEAAITSLCAGKVAKQLSLRLATFRPHLAVIINPAKQAIVIILLPRIHVTVVV